MKNSLRVCDYQNFLFFSSFTKMLIIQLNDDFMEIYESAFMRLRLGAGPSPPADAYILREKNISPIHDVCEPMLNYF